jgi:archaellin
MLEGHKTNRLAMILIAAVIAIVVVTIGSCQAIVKKAHYQQLQNADLCFTVTEQAL